MRRHKSSSLSGCWVANVAAPIAATATPAGRLPLRNSAAPAANDPYMRTFFQSIVSLLENRLAATGNSFRSLDLVPLERKRGSFVALNGRMAGLGAGSRVCGLLISIVVMSLWSDRSGTD